MAHKKGVGSSRNGRDSNPQYLGVKRFEGEKILIFKHRRRKGLRKTNGHRQNYTTLKVKDIKA